MKTLSSLLVAALLTGSFTTLAAEESIDVQISAIESAPAEQRVQLMNRFKQNLANMNEEERIKATNRLRQRLHVEERSTDALQTRSMNQMQHMNQMQQMNQFQQMNQMQQNMGQMQNMQMGGAMQGGKR